MSMLRISQRIQTCHLLLRISEKILRCTPPGVYGAVLAILCLLIPAPSLALPLNTTVGDVISGNLPDGHYDRVSIEPLGFISEIMLEDVTVSNGKITETGGGGRTQLLGFDSSIGKTDIEVRDGKLFITVAVNIPSFFVEITEEDPNYGINPTLVPLEERLTVYLSGDDWGFADVSLQVPDIKIQGFVDIKKIVFELRNDPFLFHIGGGVFITGIGKDEKSSVGIGGELAIGEIQKGIPGLIKFSMEGDGLNIDLSETGAFLQALRINVENVNLYHLAGMSLGSGCTITAGPEFGGISAFAVSADGKIRPWPLFIDITADMSMFGFIPLGGAELTYSYPYNFYVKYNTTYLGGIIGWGGSMRIGSYRDQYIRQLCPFSDKPDNGFDSSEDECVVNAIDSWARANYGFQIPNGVRYEDATEEQRENATKWDTVINGELSAYVGVPEYIPIVGGMTFGSGTARVTDKFISLYGKISAGFVDIYHVSVLIYPNEKVEWEGGGGAKIAHSVNPWETPHDQPYVFDEETQQLISLSEWRENHVHSVSGNVETKPIPIVVFMPNWKRVDAITTGRPTSGKHSVPLGEPVTTLQIPSDIPAAIIRLNYEAENVLEVRMSVQLPDGTVLDLTEGSLPDGYENVSGFSIFRPEMREAIIALSEPEGGEYIVTIENAAELGNFTVEVLAEDHVPSVEIISVETTGEPKQYKVTWYGEDLDSTATASIYLDRDRENGDGFLIGVYQENDDINTHIIQADQLPLPAGDYYVAVCIHDENNNRAWDYSDNRIRIEHEDAPDPVTGIAAGAGDGQFTIQWTSSTDENVEGYVVMYTAQGDLGNFEEEQAVYGRSSRQTTVTGLKNGVPLLVTVVSVNYDLVRSYPETVLRVIPHHPDGTTLAVPTTEPGKYAIVGKLFRYLPLFSESKRHYRDSHEMTWTLLSGPEGLSVDTGTGLITWIPTEDQVGENLVQLERTVRIRGEVIATVDESFVVTVDYAHKLHGIGNTANHVLTSPELSAVEGTTYQHQIKVNDQNGTPSFELIEGPDGMTCSGTGLLTWQVPENAKGAPTRVLITYSDGEEEEYNFFIDVISQNNTLKDSGLRLFQEFK